MRLRSVAIAALGPLVAIACGEEHRAAPTADPPPSATSRSPSLPPTQLPPPSRSGPPAPLSTDCDAGDEAWAKHAVQALLGRKPRGIQEVRVLQDMVRRTDRATVARGLLRSPEVEARWVDHLLDELHVARRGSQAAPACYDVTARPDDTGEIARHIRDHEPTEPLPDPPPTMRDVALSALRADDLSPLFRAQLFGMLVRAPSFCGNVSAVEMDVARRRWFGERFSVFYVNRGQGCLGCHNTASSVTDADTPAADRFWPIEGSFEATLFGAEAGGPELELFSAFRYRGVVSRSAVESESERSGWPVDANVPVRPWGLANDCGALLPEADVLSDAAGVDTFFAGSLGQRASVWNVERTLHLGVDALRAQGTLDDVPALSADGPKAFAYLVGTRVATRTWEAIFGRPLVLGHFFPRTVEQRDKLQALTRTFLEAHWSLRELLVSIVTDPLFNRRAPSAGCGTTAYADPPIFDPFASLQADAELRANSVGDWLHRESARAQLSMLFQALQVPAPAGSSRASIGNVERLGGYVDDQQGTPAGTDTYLSIGHWGRLTRDCKIDAKRFDVAPTRDFIDDLNAAAITQGASARDLAVALKDRLVTEPDLDEVEEAPLVATVLGVPSLAVPAKSIPDLDLRTRRYCGVLLGSRQFNVVGPPSEDQLTAPSLVIGDLSYRAQCERLASQMFANAVRVTCADGSLDVAPEP